MPKHRSASELPTQNAKPGGKLKKSRTEPPSTGLTTSRAIGRPARKSPSAPPEPMSTPADLVQEIVERKRIEAELREAEQKANDLIRFAPTAIYEIAFRGPRFTRVNDAMCHMSGYTREELLATSPFDLLDEESQSRFRQRIQAVATGQPVDETVEYKSITKDGQVRYANLQVKPIFERGIQTGAFVIAHDITERRRAEEALRQSEQQYRDLVESSNSIIMRADQNFNVTYINPFGLDYFGYTAEELIGKNVIGRTIPLRDDQGRDLEPMVKDIAANPDKYKTNVHQNMRKNGELVWVSWTNKVTYDRDGKFVDILSIGNDIDQIRKAEEAKRESERLLYAVLEGSPDPVYVKDRDSRILLANRALSQVVGKPLEQIVGKTDAEYYETSRVGQVLREDDLQIMASRTSADFEETVPTPQGERTFLSTKSPYRNASGEIIGIVGISHDITERKRAEQALEAAHQRRTEILESIQDGFLALDRAWRFVYINSRAASNVGFSKESLIGQNIWSIFPTLVGTVHETHYRRAMDERVPVHFETDGILTHASYDIRVYPSAEGISVYWLDITERKQNETKIQNLNRELERQKTELLAANQDLESFSYSVSHDLRSPLGSIDAFTSMILKDYGAQLPHEMAQLLQLVRENTDQMSRLIEALLLLSRTSRQVLKRQTVEPRPIVQDVLKMLQPQFGGRQVEILVGELPACQADPVLLRQVYANLLSNALKFTRSRPAARIEVGSDTALGETVYFIKDNGVGFDMEQAGKLFGVFQRLHGEEEYEGTGIGLAIVQRIIRRHGGRVWAESEVDKGAVFYFTL